MASCLFVTATLFLTLTFVASGIAFFGPFWMYSGADYGLWGRCASGRCTWIWENDFAASKSSAPFNEGWFIATQALFGTGFLLVLGTEIYSRCQLCCEGRSGLARSAGFLLITACLLMGAGVGVFGGFMENKRSGRAELEWGFWSGVVGTGMSLVTGLLFIFVAGCGCDRKFS